MTRTEILEAANRCVCGERDEQYGTPENSFAVIAELWTTYIEARCVSQGAAVDMTAADVAALMALMKIARIATGVVKNDNWIDLAGYAACGGELEGANADD